MTATALLLHLSNRFRNQSGRLSPSSIRAPGYVAIRAPRGLQYPLSLRLAEVVDLGGPMLSPLFAPTANIELVLDAFECGVPTHASFLAPQRVWHEVSGWGEKELPWDPEVPGEGSPPSYNTILNGEADDS